MEEKLNRRPHRMELENRGAGASRQSRTWSPSTRTRSSWTRIWGLLTIKGKELHVSRLTLEKGEVDIEGTIDSMVYSSNEALRKSGESLFTRLFK